MLLLKNMKALLLIAVFFSLNIFSEDTILGLCQVSSVMAGRQNTYIYLENCNGNLGFKDKTMVLPHHIHKSFEEIIDNIINIRTVDTTPDVLGQKQTAELAYLHQLKLRVQLKYSDDNTPVYLSLAESLPQPKEVAAPQPLQPNPSSSNCNPSQPTNPDKDFKPVPPPPGGFLRFFHLK